MNSRFRGLLWGVSLVVLGATGCALLAQQAAQPARPASQAVTAGSASGQSAERATAPAYSADQVTETTQTLADGTTITQKSLIREYRDGQGRSRREYFGTRVDSPGLGDSPQSITILDPVAGVSYFLNPGDHTARKQEMPRPSPSPGARVASPRANLTPAPPAMPRWTREELGTQVIEGLEAKGHRITRIIPEGAEGNDKPIQTTTEMWVAAKEQVVLLQISNDPRRGQRVTRATNLVLDEPPAELFQVPADYTVKELQPVAKPEPPSD